ncbi:hypothetical protein QBC42DRAFT_298469 [Cladorrhinum samala]|uniref:DUF7704 domain-containing protein n=1 Tax=Cladorrhinum samala TaxID=585594 RepID=A0AAV9HJP3_9PEZI|nr:hypothetical protein QBC42DRAFT_298469 [Cladorrhinum samala]
MSYTSSRALPTIPLIFLGFVEPAMLIYGYVTGLLSPYWYYSIQSPQSPLPISVGPTAASFPPQAEGTTIQLVNLFVVLGLTGAFCAFSRDPRTVKGFLVAYGLGDFGHVWALYKGLGGQGGKFWDVGVWNDAVWGGVAASVVFGLVRWSSLLGVFGPIGGKGEEGRKKRE